MKKIVFITGTRADYGKIKSLMNEVKNQEGVELHVFVTGMHMLSLYGSTWREIEKDGFTNLYKYINQTNNTTMDIALSNTIVGLSNYVNEIKPDLLIVHGDRIEAYAGAIVGALNNIRVAHIEGGELSGTIDESIRHSITKLAHIHLVSNEDSKKRILQMGENEASVFVIGSPDIDIMTSDYLPTISEAKKHYEIDFNQYAIVLYHPVTTDPYLQDKVKIFVDSLIKSNENYIVIYPNNDFGNAFIFEEYKRLEKIDRFKIYPSIRFEYFLTLMKNAKFMIGNSSAAIRETTIYGTASIDVGNRQSGRYSIENSPTIQHVDYSEKEICEAIDGIKNKTLKPSTLFGDGQSMKVFGNILMKKDFWNVPIQKSFFDY